MERDKLVGNVPDDPRQVRPNYWHFAAELSLLVIVGATVWIPYLWHMRPMDYFRDMAKGHRDAKRWWL